MKNLEILLKENNLLLYHNIMLGIINSLDIPKDDREILLLLLQNRDKNYLRINNNKKCYDNIKSYLDLLRPIKVDKKYLTRVGGDEDGGYIMITPPQYENLYRYINNKIMKSGVAFSLGVSERAPWDLEMANLGYSVIEYDASINESPYKDHDKIVFYKKFIGTNKQKREDPVLYETLQDIIEQKNLNEKHHNILQIDIENAEWDMINETNFELINKYFSQVIFEFHGCNPEENDGAKKRLQLLEKVNQYYYPIHTHFNNHGKIFYCNGLFFSTTIEVSYVRKSDIDFSIEYKSNSFLKELDFPVDTSAPEIPVRFL